MSAYLEFFRNVPRSARSIADLIDAKGANLLPGIINLGNVNPKTKTWDAHYFFKYSMWGHLFTDHMGLIAYSFIPAPDDGLIHLSRVVHRVEEFRAALPACLEAIDRSDDRDKDQQRHFLEALMAGIDQALIEQPDGTGFAIVAN